MRRRLITGIAILLTGAALLLASCGSDGGDTPEEADKKETGAEEATQTPEAPTEDKEMTNDPKLLYMGHASIRIVTGEGKVIYIDPFAGDAYDLPADLILVTHAHSDHTALDLIKDRSDDCRVITQKEALKEKSFDLEYVKVKAVEAGNNKNHDIHECVGYVLTFSNGRKVYVSGDTSTTDQMSQLADEEIDYAFFCCDGVYNMDLDEAAKCAELVGAKHNIPYHIVAADDPGHFDRQRAEKFNAPNKMILEPGEEIDIE